MKCIKHFQNIEEEYYQLSENFLFNISVLYSLLNSVCIQLVIHLGDPSTSLVHEIFVMFIGDMTGIALLAFFFVVVYKLFCSIKKLTNLIWVDTWYLCYLIMLNQGFLLGDKRSQSFPYVYCGVCL